MIDHRYNPPVLKIGPYEYSILFVVNDGQIRAGIDPAIINNPEE